MAWASVLVWQLIVWLVISVVSSVSVSVAEQSVPLIWCLVFALLLLLCLLLWSIDELAVRVKVEIFLPLVLDFVFGFWDSFSSMLEVELRISLVPFEPLWLVWFQLLVVSG